ncbi:MAG: class I SAM-dependent methyltransferase [Gallionella sp.]|nr:class I SAM-dependent methyltransferase [Gallionella sp.]
MKNIIGHLQLIWLMKSPPALFSRLFELPWYRDMLERWCEPLLTPHASVLEVGCAGGDFSRLLAERSMKVSGIDRSAQMLKKAKQTPSSVQFKQADATQLPFPNQHFDVVLAASLINIVDSPRAVLNEMKRVCREGGTVSVLVPSSSFSNADVKRYLETTQLTGFSAAALMMWHCMGRKVNVDSLHNDFKECRMTNIATQTLLGGMIVTVSGHL